MKGFTYGGLNIRATSVVSNLTKAQLRNALRNAKFPGGQGITSGWGGISIADENDNRPAIVRTAPGDPALVNIGPADNAQQQTSIVLARHIKDYENTNLTSRLAPADVAGLDPAARYLQDYVDVAIVDDTRPAPQAAGGANDNRYLVLTGTHDDDEVAEVLGAITGALPPNATWAPGAAFLPITGDRDLFLWLAYRWLHAANLTPTLVIIDFREVSARTPSGYGLLASKGFSAERLDVLVHICKGHPIGPLKLAVADTASGLTVDFQLLNNGDFAIHRSATVFADQPLQRADLGVRSVVTFAQQTAQALAAAHKADPNWTAAAKTAFRAWARDEIINNL